MSNKSLSNQFEIILKSILAFCLFSFFSIQSIFADCIYDGPIQAVELQIGNMITWVTAKEQGNDKFIIQKSLDGVAFETIGEIKGAGTTDVIQRYRYLDTKLGAKKTLYRIIQVDVSGARNHLPTVVLNRNQENQFMISGLSSPMTDGPLNLTIRSQKEGELNYSVRRISNSQIIETNSISIVEGGNMISLYLGHLYKPGLYDLKFDLDGEIENITIQKVNENEAPTVNYAVKE